jgi:hypothetical protein
MDVGQVTIDMLPDIALLEFFDFYVAQFPDPPVYNAMIERRGSRWCTCVENGETSSLGHHVA